MEKNNINKKIFIDKKAILEAGNLLLKNKASLNEVILSSNKDVKLKADIDAEKIIKTIIENDSDYPILGEESGLSAETIPNIFWVVDPLDGTANYARNIPICCVSIALISDLKPILGVIYDFINNDLYEGSINTKALVNGKEISVSKVSNSQEGILLTGLPNNTDYSDNALLKMIKDFQKINIPKLPVFTTEDGISTIKDFFGKLNEWKNISDLIPGNFKTSNNLRRTGQAAILAGSLELVK